MDSNLFIDTQMIESYYSRYNGFRASFYADDNGNLCYPATRYLSELLTAHEDQRDRASDHHADYERARRNKIAKWRDKHTLQMIANYGVKARFTSRQKSALIRFKQLCQTFAEMYRNHRDYTTSDFCETLNAIKVYNNTCAYNAFEALNEKAGFWCTISRCDDCSEYYDSDEVRLTSSDDTICERCCDNNYYWSECEDVYIYSDNAISVYHSVRAYNNGSSSDYCTERYAERNFYEWDGHWFSDEDDRNEVRSEEGGDDEDDDGYPYGEDRSDGLNGYHNSYRDFTEQNAKGTRPALGVELEVYAEERADAVADLKDNFSAMIYERDGSLSEEHGFEIITVPYGLEEWNGIIPSFTKTLHENGVVGFNEPAGSGYGIHVTIHRRHFSALAEARISLFLSAHENANFVRAIAQRDQIYSAHNGIGIDYQPMSGKLKTHHISNGKTSCYHNGVRKTKIMGKGKYAPVNWKSEQNLAEFRLFQSTTNPSSFAKNLEFVWAMHAWTKASTGSSYHHRDFLIWLNKPENRKDYPFLTGYLSKKVFYGTNFAPIISSWQHLMVKPVETSAMEPMAA